MLGALLGFLSRLPSRFHRRGAFAKLRGISHVTVLLERAEAADPNAAEALLPLVYEELRQLAAARMARESPDQTLQPTALVHEAWLRLAAGPDRAWNDRQHFFRAAAEAMRRILVDRARERRARKRGGDLVHTELSESKIAELPDSEDETIEIHEALEELGRRDAVSADLVKLRYFVGMRMAEAADALNLPLRSAERMWTFARAWLRKEIQNQRA